MGMKQPSWRVRPALSGEAGPDDGVDPRLEARSRSRAKARAWRSGVEVPGAVRSTGDRHAHQLGRQVARTLDDLFAGESRDEVLLGLRVVSVVPAPDAAHLLVTVEPPPPADHLDPAVVMAHLQRASGWLRSEVAASVTRKRAPALAFRLAPPSASDGR